MGILEAETAAAIFGALAMHKVRSVIEEGIREGHTDVQSAGFGMLVIERFTEPTEIPASMRERGMEVCELIAREYREDLRARKLEFARELNRLPSVNRSW